MPLRCYLLPRENLEYFRKSETSLIENKIPDLKYYLSAAHEFYS